MTDITIDEVGGIFWEHWETLAEFAQCLADDTIVTNLSDAVAIDGVIDAREVVQVHIESILVTTRGEATLIFEELVSGAASLEFLVRYAHQLDPQVFPPDAIPSGVVVDAALQLSRQEQQA